MTRDFAIVEELDGTLTLHTATCAAARLAAAAGQPVLTLLDCQRDPLSSEGLELARHDDCLDLA